MAPAATSIEIRSVQDIVRDRQFLERFIPARAGRSPRGSGVPLALSIAFQAGDVDRASACGEIAAPGSETAGRARDALAIPHATTARTLGRQVLARSFGELEEAAAAGGLEALAQAAVLLSAPWASPPARRRLDAIASQQAQSTSSIDAGHQHRDVLRAAHDARVLGDVGLDLSVEAQGTRS